MKVLIVAATGMEIAIYLAQASGSADVLITGVGAVATTYALVKKLQFANYDLVLQVGVGGSFDSNIPLGEVVFITSDRFGDVGAEDHESYIDVFGLGLQDRDGHPFKDGSLLTPLTAIHETIDLRQVNALTVNTVSGNEKTISRRRKEGCAVESMEGAALHYVCLQEGVPFAQIRSISNYVIPRDKSQWKMKEAIINLNNWLIGFTANL